MSFWGDDLEFEVFWSRYIRFLFMTICANFVFQLVGGQGFRWLLSTVRLIPNLTRRKNGKRSGKKKRKKSLGVKA